MPNPKRKHSKSRGGSRAHSHKIAQVALVPCPQCKELKRPHSVCPVCGHYRGAAVVQKKEKKAEKKS